jgi:hypothetical protein
MIRYRYIASILFSRQEEEYDHTIADVFASDETWATRKAHDIGTENPPDNRPGWKIDNIKIMKVIGKNFIGKDLVAL